VGLNINIFVRYNSSSLRVVSNRFDVYIEARRIASESDRLVTSSSGELARVMNYRSPAIRPRRETKAVLTRARSRFSAARRSLIKDREDPEGCPAVSGIARVRARARDAHLHTLHDLALEQTSNVHSRASTLEPSPPLSLSLSLFLSLSISHAK
jgi:hypothetical protein